MILVNVSALINYVFIAFIVLSAGALLFLRFSSKKEESEETQEFNERKFSIDSITEYVKNTLNEITNSNLYDLGLSEEEFRRRARKRAELRRALKECSLGDIHNKSYVKTFIYDLLRETYGFNDQNINYVLHFEEPLRLSSQDKFEILIHVLKKKHKFNAIDYLFKKYKLDDLKTVTEGEDSPSYIITPDEIDQVFRKEVKALSFEDKLWIIVQRVYQQYKGFGVIDEIRDMNIDGVSGGVSGLPASSVYFGEDGDIYTEQMSKVSIPKDYDSVWVFYKGKSIHLSFLSFGSELELKRVCQNIYKFNNPGQLTEVNGYKVNQMKDGSRVVVVRPNMAESWAFFVRKFDIPNASLDILIDDAKFGNASMVRKLLIYLMKGCRVTAFTGAQGSGKTTLMMAVTKYIAAMLPLRIQEMAFELHLRKIYPWRNILSFRETDTVSGQEGLDLQKKTDGSVNILGEVATDPVAAWMIQMAQVASLFTIFSHHAKTFPDLVEALRNSLLKERIFSDEKIAELQVVRLINFDVHLVRDYDGKRYIERITECIPLARDEEYPMDFAEAKSFKEIFRLFAITMAEFFRRQTDRKTYEYRDIIRYVDGDYVWVNDLSEHNREEMKKHMSASDRQEFEEFLSSHAKGDAA